MRRSAALICLALLVHCAPDDGHAVDLTLRLDGSVTTEMAMSVRTLRFAVTGAEVSDHAYPTQGAFAGGVERIVYEPKAAGGVLTFSARAEDASGGLIASGQTQVTLLPGKTAAGMLTLSAVSATPPLLQADTGHVDLGSIAVGQSSAIATIEIQNRGTEATAPLMTFVNGDVSDFLVGDHCSPGILPGGGTCSLTVAFAPIDVGPKGVMLTVSTDDGGFASIVITAMGTAPSRTLTVVNESAGGSGSLTSDDGSINCGTTCGPVGYLVTQQVTLTATPMPGSQVTWSGNVNCAGSQATTCTFMMDQDRQVTATFKAAQPNYVFVSSVTWNTGAGIASADAICNSVAQTAKLPDVGSYVAWLSTKTQSAASRLGAARGWVRTDGSPFADTVAGLTHGRAPMLPVTFTESGLPLQATINIYTGTMADGTVAANNCKDWSSASSGDLSRTGRSDVNGLEWTEYIDIGCTSTAYIYCLGTAQNAPLVYEKTPGRIAFFGGNGWLPPQGLAAADSACQAEASANALPGTYRALLATTGASAASRFDGSGLTWVRPDGIALAATAAALLSDARLDALPDQGADGSFGTRVLAWAGANDLQTAGTDATTCTNWSSSTGSADDGYSTLPYFFSPGTVDCSATFPIGLYCLQE